MSGLIVKVKSAQVRRNLLYIGEDFQRDSFASPYIPDSHLITVVAFTYGIVDLSR